MDLLDLTLESPAENLAFDEALLLDADQGAGGAVLRFWTSPAPFLVLGIGGRVREEVFWDDCLEQGVPVLRRCSGGGTVLQGPGCLSYALILPIQPESPTASITLTNRFVMEQNARALADALDLPVMVEGFTDLAVHGRKISGNSQRRLRQHLLFHGTIMLSLDHTLMERLLRVPARQPGYRASRSHEHFVSNLGAEPATVRHALASAWQAEGAIASAARQRLLARTRQLVGERYGRNEWNLKW